MLRKEGVELESRACLVTRKKGAVFSDTGYGNEVIRGVRAGRLVSHPAILSVIQGKDVG